MEKNQFWRQISLVHAEQNQVKQIAAELLRTLHVLIYIFKKWV